MVLRSIMANSQKNAKPSCQPSHMTLSLQRTFLNPRRRAKKKASLSCLLSFNQQCEVDEVAVAVAEAAEAAVKVPEHEAEEVEDEVE